MLMATDATIGFTAVSEKNVPHMLMTIPSASLQIADTAGTARKRARTVVMPTIPELQEEVTRTILTYMNCTE